MQTVFQSARLRRPVARIAVWLLVVWLGQALVLPPTALAHGGEDHGAAQKTVTIGKNTIAHTVRAGDFEITLKHQPLEPDKAATALIFVTRFASNEAVNDANQTIEIIGENGKIANAVAAASQSKGSYTVALPALPAGIIDLKTRITAADKTETAVFADIAVKPLENSVAERTSSVWRTIEFVAWAIVLLGLLGATVYFGLRLAKKDERASGATASV